MSDEPVIAKDLLFRPAPLFEVKYETKDVSGSGYEDYTELVVVHNGVKIAREHEGSEPEDNLFSRDYAWIKPLLEEVYALGVQDGKEAKADEQLERTFNSLKEQIKYSKSAVKAAREEHRALKALRKANKGK